MAFVPLTPKIKSKRDFVSPKDKVTKYYYSTKKDKVTIKTLLLLAQAETLASLGLDRLGAQGYYLH